MRVPGLRTYQIRIPHKILGRNCGLTFVLAQKLENQFFGHVTFLGGHVMVPELRKYQIRIPRKIIGRNCGLTFVSSSEIKNLIFWVGTRNRAFFDILVINRTIKYVSIFFCNKLDTDLLQYFNRYITRHLLAQ